MLPILVLLVAFSSLASAGVLQYKPVSYNDPRYEDNSLIGRVFKSFDAAGYGNLNEVYLGAVQKDLASQGGNQALTNGQVVAFIGELSVGRPGDACAAANYINAYTRYVASGNSGGVREALRNYIQLVNNNIDNTVKKLTNSESVRFASGSRGGCAGEGRTYEFEPAWDIILGSAAPNQQRLIDEQYCVVKRLYCAFNAVSNNVAAHVTASALPPTRQVFDLAGRAINTFLSSVAGKSNLGQSAASLKQALASAVNKVTL